MVVTERDIAYEAELTILKTATSGLTVKFSRDRYNRFSAVEIGTRHYKKVY
jgi:hypothetical protein